MLQYTLRIRDLVHGTILFTEKECQIINHPFFQRIRHIRQNDVAFYVYPSINTSRFEHALGTCRVTGMMAENLTKGHKWKTYLKELRSQTGIALVDEFIQLARLYALLHDIGHLPLSHLFEMAVTEYRKFKKPPLDSQELIAGWTGKHGFEKLHEAFGAIIVERVVHDVALPEPIRRALLKLMTEKTISSSHPLSVIKLLVDSEIDADRIDFVQRDGLLAGGEYGNYDIRRLCDSVFLEESDREWFVVYSEKALTSMEALLLDRYRTHIWIHFHHRVVIMKMLVRFLIVKALQEGLITKEHFNPANINEFSLRDDTWLWNVLRGIEAKDNLVKIIQRAIFYREKQNVFSLWKTRPTYHELWERVKKEARVLVIDYGKPDMYSEFLTKNIGIYALIMKVEFKPLTKDAVLLYSEAKKKLTGKNLLDVSELVAHIETLWKDEPQEFILFAGKNVAQRAEQLKKKWFDLTVRRIRG